MCPHGKDRRTNFCGECYDADWARANPELAAAQQRQSELNKIEYQRKVAVDEAIIDIAKSLKKIASSLSMIEGKR